MTTTTRRELDFLAIARDYAQRAAWGNDARFDPEQRWYRKLNDSDELEVWLLTWLPGQGTDLHDHGDSSGAMWVVSGELTEYTVAGSRREPRLLDRKLASGQGRRFGTHYIHQVTNNGPAPAISVHAYGPALATMTSYALTDNGLDVVHVDEAGVQW